MSEDSDPIDPKYRNETLPVSEEEIRARHESNRSGWNEGASYYTRHLNDSIAALKAGRSNLHPIERVNLGELKPWCHTAVHLQCASGYDTLSLWLEGVEQVVGVDISDVHIDNARLMSAALQAPAQWYRCDVLDTPHELDGTADLVYTGRGALCWLHDLDSWARVIARLLKPQGIFHILDDHPTTWLFDQEAATLRYSGICYFNHTDSSQGWPDSYIGELAIPLEQQARKYERLWTLMEIFGAIQRAGLVVEYLGEHPEPYWNGFPNLKTEFQNRIPMTFSLKARKPKL